MSNEKTFEDIKAEIIRMFDEVENITDQQTVFKKLNQIDRLSKKAEAILKKNSFSNSSNMDKHEWLLKQATRSLELTLKISRSEK